MPTSSWTASSLTGETALWVPVLPFDENRKALALEAQGRWAWTSTGDEGAYHLHALRLPEAVGVLPVLELDPSRLGGKLGAASAMLRISPEDLMAALPLADLFGIAFETRSDYWIARALRWMEVLPKSRAPAAVLQAVVNDQQVSQRNRHRIRRLLSKEN